MRIHTFSCHPYEISFTHGLVRSGFLIRLTNDKGCVAEGDIAPLPKWSQETFQEALEQCIEKKEKLLKIEWSNETYCKELEKLNLFPSVIFGLESALLTLLDPLPAHPISVSALLMGSAQEILAQAILREKEGFTSAKLKVGNLEVTEAEKIIHQLKDRFHLRIDVNRAWSTEKSLLFFAKFPLDTFDYVEEPLQNPKDLSQFPHPIAVDESFPQDLSLEDLEKIPTLKALIYKPTLQGGMMRALPLHRWAKQRGIALVLSSSFESDHGLMHIVSMAHRLSLKDPVGIGTYHYVHPSVELGVDGSSTKKLTREGFLLDLGSCGGKALRDVSK